MSWFDENLCGGGSLDVKTIAPWITKKERKNEVHEHVQCMHSQLYIIKLLAHLSWKLNWTFLIACCPSSICLSGRKLFILQDQFWPDLVQIPQGRGFKFIQIKHPSSRGDNYKKEWKVTELNEKSSSYSLGEGNLNFFKQRTRFFLKGR
jgi:hypothetical protein